MIICRLFAIIMASSQQILEIFFPVTWCVVLAQITPNPSPIFCLTFLKSRLFFNQFPRSGNWFSILNCDEEKKRFSNAKQSNFKGFWGKTMRDFRNFRQNMRLTPLIWSSLSQNNASCVREEKFQNLLQPNLTWTWRGMQAIINILSQPIQPQPNILV